MRRWVDERGMEREGGDGCGGYTDIAGLTQCTMSAPSNRDVTIRHVYR